MRLHKQEKRKFLPEKYAFTPWDNHWFTVACDYRHGYWIFFLFTNSQFNTMIRNYRAGNCSITIKGLYRYSSLWMKINSGRDIYPWQPEFMKLRGVIH